MISTTEEPPLLGKIAVVLHNIVDSFVCIFNIKMYGINKNIQFLCTKMLLIYVTNVKKVVCIIHMSSITALPVDVRVTEVRQGCPCFFRVSATLLDAKVSK